jgi:hypothetical protein
MVGWIVRGALILAGLIASWFVAEDAVNFTVIQMTIAVLLVVGIVLTIAFWPSRWLPWRRPHP